MTNKLLLLISAYAFLVSPATAGNQLFPPDNAKDGSKPCDNEHHRLYWTGNSVECKPLSLEKTCPSGHFMIGINEKGEPNCDGRLANFANSCANGTIGGTVHKPVLVLDPSLTGGWFEKKITLRMTYGMKSGGIVGVALNCGTGGGTDGTPEPAPKFDSWSASINHTHATGHFP